MKKLKTKETIKIMNSIEATLSKKEHFNPFMQGYGVHGDSKYNRKKLPKIKNIMKDEYEEGA